MIVELTLDEAEIVIAALTFAEGAALGMNPGMVEALAALRPWRSVLLRTYLRQLMITASSASREAADAAGPY